MKPLTWVGWFNSTASFPVVNGNLTAALERRGWPVQRNVHNIAWGPELTPLAVAFQYPPQAMYVKHPVNICCSLWEFSGGARAVPDSFKQVFADFDVIFVPNQFVYEQYIQATKTPVRIVRYLGVDTEHFSPAGNVASIAGLFPGETWMNDAAKIVLMVGGSDKRHGWDLAEQVIQALPDDVHLIAKLSKHYPRVLSEPEHPRIHKLYADLVDLAPLYRACDAFLMTARGVGFALPVIEALACGLPVASTNLPPIRDYANERVIFAEGGHYEPMGVHHVHDDCLPDWREPDLNDLIVAAQQALTLPKQAPSEEWRARWSWDGIAADFSAALESYEGSLVSMEGAVNG